MLHLLAADHFLHQCRGTAQMDTNDVFDMRPERVEIDPPARPLWLARFAGCAHQTVRNQGPQDGLDGQSRQSVSSWHPRFQ